MRTGRLRGCGMSGTLFSILLATLPMQDLAYAVRPRAEAGITLGMLMIHMT